MTLQKQSPLPLKRKSREVKKLEGERDRALGRLNKIKTKRKAKKSRQQRQTLAGKVVSLAAKHTQALIDGEI